MKKISCFLLFPLLLCFSCTSQSKIPLKAGDSSEKLGQYLSDSVELHSRNSFYFFQDGEWSYMMTEALHTPTITKFESYPSILPSIYDFFRLTTYMDIYDAAKIVGVPYELAQTSTFWVVYHTKEGKNVNIGLVEYFSNVFYDGSLIIYDPK